MDSSYHRVETPTVSQQETFLTSLFVSAHLSLEITHASCVHVQVADSNAVGLGSLNKWNLMNACPW